MTTSVNVMLFIFAASVLLTNDVIAMRPTKRVQKMTRKLIDFYNCCREIKCHRYDCILIPGKSKTACKCMSDRSHNFK